MGQTGQVGHCISTALVKEDYLSFKMNGYTVRGGNSVRIVLPPFCSKQIIYLMNLMGIACISKGNNSDRNISLPFHCGLLLKEKY